MLWTIAPKLVLFLVAYAFVGTYFTASVFGKRLMHLQYLNMEQEGNLRFNLVRTRENAGKTKLGMERVEECACSALSTGCFSC